MATIHYKYPQFPGERCENNCDLCSSECMHHLSKGALYKTLCRNLWEKILEEALNKIDASTVSKVFATTCDELFTKIDPIVLHPIIEEMFTIQPDAPPLRYRQAVLALPGRLAIVFIPTQHPPAELILLKNRMRHKVKKETRIRHS